MRLGWGACKKVAFTVAAAAMVSLGGVPAGPAGAATPAAVVTPSTGLVDYQSVDVEGSGFSPNVGLWVIECPAGVSDTSACDYATAQWPWTDSAGDVTAVRMTVKRVIRAAGASVDCVVTACVVLISETVNPAGFATATLEFDPSVPPRPILAIDLKVDQVGSVDPRTGEVTLTGSVTCNAPADVLLQIDVTQRVGGAVRNAGPGGSVVCDGTVRWHASGTGFDTVVKAGFADVNANAYGYLIGGGARYPGDAGDSELLRVKLVGRRTRTAT